MSVHNLRERLNWLDRQQVVELLGSISIGCVGDESTDYLRDALQINIEEGEIEDST